MKLRYDNDRKGAEKYEQRYYFNVSFMRRLIHEIKNAIVMRKMMRKKNDRKERNYNYYFSYKREIFKDRARFPYINIANSIMKIDSIDLIMIRIMKKSS